MLPLSACCRMACGLEWGKMTAMSSLLTLCQATSTAVALVLCLAVCSSSMLQMSSVLQGGKVSSIMAVAACNAYYCIIQASYVEPVSRDTDQALTFATAAAIVVLMGLFCFL